MKTKNIVLLVVALILLTVGVTARSVSDKKDEPIRKVVKESIKQGQKELADEGFDMRAIFIDGCVEEEAGQEAYCGCVYDVIVKDIGEEGFASVVIEFARGNMSDETTEIFTTAVMKCIDKFEL